MSRSTKARIHAGHMARAIWTDLFPHADMPKAPSLRYQDADCPGADVRLKIATTGEPPQPGDLVVLVTTEGMYGTNLLRSSTAREIVHRHEHTVRVERVTPSTIVAHEHLVIPNGGWTEDLTRLGESVLKDPVTSRYALNSTTRLIGILGNAEELRARAAAHPDFPAWQKAQAAAQAEADAAQAEAERLQKERDERERPFKEAAEAFNALVPEPLFTWNSGFGGEDGTATLIPWLSEGDHLYVYLNGLVRLGHLTRERYHAATGHAATLGTEINP